MLRLPKRIPSLIVAVMVTAAFLTVLPSAESTNDTEAMTLSISHYVAGLMMDWYGMNDEAIAEYEQASSYDAESYVIHLRLGANYIQAQNYPKAIEELKKAADLKPDELQSHYLLALAYSAIEDFVKANQEYEAILKGLSNTDPENVEVYSYLGQLYYSQKQYDKAIEQFKRILVVEPKNAEVMSILGSLYLETGQRDKAIEQFQQAIDIDPHHDGSLNSLGYIYAEDGIHLDKAVELVKRALEVSPNNGAYLDSLGWAYYQKGMYEEALRYLQQAVTFYEDPVIYDHLGDTYLKIGQEQKAIEHWQKALELEPDQPQIQEKIDKLQ